jgi:hypothetical protein
MTITELIFLIQFLGLMGVVGYYFFKVMSIGLSYMKKEPKKEQYDIVTGFKWDFVLFAVMLLSYAIGRITFMITAGYSEIEEVKLLYAGIMSIENIVVMLGFVLFLVCIFQNIKDMATKPISAYKAEKRTLGGYNN